MRYAISVVENENIIDGYDSDDMVIKKVQIDKQYTAMVYCFLV